LSISCVRPSLPLYYRAYNSGHHPDDVINTVITSLTTISKSQKRPAFGSIFLLNNISYLRMHILLEPRTQNLPKLLSRQTQDTLNSNFRTAKAEYFNANFMPLLQMLSDETGGSTGGGSGGGGIGGIGGGGAKAATKERFTKFFDLFKDVAERHQMARVLEDDIEG
jgi:exocyst complex component 7